MDRRPPSGLVPLNTTSALSVAQSTRSLSELEHLKKANEAANRVFKASLDFHKSTPELLAVVTEYLASLSPEMLGRVTSVSEGIHLKTKFIPTVFDFHTLVMELEEKDNRFKRSHTHYQYFRPLPEHPPAPVDDGGVPGFHCPFPKLARAFEADLDLLRGKPFEVLSGASRALAVSGRDEAQRLLGGGQDGKPLDAAKAKAPELELEF
jgi:hypothetical protein